MQGKGAGAVNRVELECQVLCAALRQSWVRHDKVGAFTSIRELSHLFPDLLPPPEEDRNASNKANYYEVLTVRPGAGLNGLVVGYLRTVRKFLSQYNPKDYRQFYNTVLNAGFVLRKPRLRLSHDLVVARRWLYESQLEDDEEAAAEISETAVAVGTVPEEVSGEAVPAEVPAEVETSAEIPVEVALEIPVEIAPEIPVEVASEIPVEVAPEIPVEVAPEHQVEVAPEHPVEVQYSLQYDEPAAPEVHASATFAPYEESSPELIEQEVTTTSEYSEEVTTPPLEDQPEFAPPIEPSPAAVTAEYDPLAAIEASYEQIQTEQQRPSTFEAPPEHVRAAEPTMEMPKVEPISATPQVEPTAPLAATTPVEPAQPQVEPAPPVTPPRSTREAAKPAAAAEPSPAFHFDEKQLRKPEADIVLPGVIRLMEASHLITKVEVQALKAQMQLAPNITAEQLVLNAGYATRHELLSLRLAQDLLSSGKITMAQFQVAMYDERTSGLRMAESLQVRGWLETEVRNSIEEFKKNES